MKRIFSVICFVFLLPTYGFTQTPAESYQIDATLTANAPWKPGEVVYTRTKSQSWGVVYKVERRFLGLTKPDHFLVQDFYEKSDTKYTDPYLLISPSSVVDGLADLNACLFPQPILSGAYVGWYINGGKMESCYNLNGQLHGEMAFWYDNGQKMLEGSYNHGQPVGIWYSWDQEGHILEQYDHGSQ